MPNFTSRQMLPSTSGSNVTDRSLIDSVCSAQASVRKRGVSDFQNILFCNLLFPPDFVPFSVEHVSGVILRCANQKMPRIAATRVIARVTNHNFFVSLWYRSISHLVCVDMGQFLFSIYPKRAIPGPCEPSHVRPAILRFSPAYLARKPFFGTRMSSSTRADSRALARAKSRFLHSIHVSHRDFAADLARQWGTILHHSFPPYDSGIHCA